MSDSKFLKPIESRPQNLNPVDRQNWQKFNASVDDLTPEFRKWLIDFFLVEVVPLIPAKQIAGGTTTYAPYDSAYVTIANDANLSSERALSAGSGITITDGGAGSTVTIASTVSSGAATSEPFVTIGNTSGLGSERALTAGSGITITDGGANSTVTIANAGYIPGGTDVALADGGTGASLVDPNADRILFWDDSAGQVTWLTPGTNLTITGTQIDASGTGGTVAAGYVMARA